MGEFFVFTDNDSFSKKIMNASLIAKLEQLSMRLEEVGVMLSDPDVASNQNK
jgi:hypothetical protein